MSPGRKTKWQVNVLKSSIHATCAILCSPSWEALKDIREFIQGRDHLCANSVEESLLSKAHWTSICRHIHIKNPSCAKCVVCHSLNLVASRGTWDCTLVKNLMCAQRVRQPLWRKALWTSTWGLIPVKSHTCVKSVEQHSLNLVAWRDTWWSTLALNLTHALTVGLHF